MSLQFGMPIDFSVRGKCNVNNQLYIFIHSEYFLEITKRYWWKFNFVLVVLDIPLSPDMSLFALGYGPTVHEEGKWLEMGVCSSSSEIHDFLRRGDTAVFHMLCTCPLNTEAGLVFSTSLNGKELCTSAL